MTVKTDSDRDLTGRDAASPVATQVLFPEARARHRHRLLWIGAGILLVVLASVAALVASGRLHRSSAPATTPKQFASTCRSSALLASFDGVDSGLAGSFLVGFQIQNNSASSCTVQGYPTALFRDANGPVNGLTVQRMGAIVHGRSVTASPRIQLRPGGRAYVNMIESECTGRSSGPFNSVQLVLNGAVIPGVITVGRGSNQPFAIGWVCPPKDPGTYPAFSPLEPTRDII